MLSASRFADQKGTIATYPLLFVFGLLPQVLIGFGFSRWMAPGDLSWALGAMSILVMGMMLGVFLGRRPFQLFFAKMGLWAPVALNAVAHGYTIAAVALGAPGALSLGWRVAAAAVRNALRGCS